MKDCGIQRSDQVASLRRQSPLGGPQVDVGNLLSFPDLPPGQSLPGDIAWSPAVHHSWTLATSNTKLCSSSPSAILWPV